MPGVDNRTIKRIARLEHNLEQLQDKVEYLFININNIQEYLQQNVAQPLKVDVYYGPTSENSIYCGQCNAYDPIGNTARNSCPHHDCVYGNSMTRDIS